MKTLEQTSIEDIKEDKHYVLHIEIYNPPMMDFENENFSIMGSGKEIIDYLKKAGGFQSMLDEGDISTIKEFLQELQNSNGDGKDYYEVYPID